MSDADRRLALCDSQNRAAQLVKELQSVSKREARDLLVEWFNMCDALAPWADELREQFERVGYVVDDADEPLRMPVTVYRGAWDDDDPYRALSWTLKREVAERFCRGLVSMRAKLILGIYRADAEPVIWQATCHQALGYLTSRGESEVIADVISNPMIVAKLVTAHEEEEE